MPSISGAPTEDRPEDQEHPRTARMAARTQVAAASGPARRPRAVRVGIATASEQIAHCGGSDPHPPAPAPAGGGAPHRSPHQLAAPPRRTATVPTTGTPPSVFPARRGRWRCRGGARHRHHVQRDDHRFAQLAALPGEAQVQAQVGGVDHAPRSVRRGFTGMAPRSGRAVASSGLAGCRPYAPAGRSAYSRAGRRAHAGLLALDGDAGVVGHLLPAAGEQVEQRGLAAVGLPIRRASGMATPAFMPRPPFAGARRASARRSAKRVKPICTSSGSGAERAKRR